MDGARSCRSRDLIFEKNSRNYSSCDAWGVLLKKAANRSYNIMYKEKVSLNCKEKPYFKFVLL